MGFGMKLSFLQSITLALALLSGRCSEARAAADATGLGEASFGGSSSRSRAAVLFRNGDLLYGALDSINPSSAVRWRHPDADQPIDFLPESITEIHFPLRPH